MESTTALLDRHPHNVITAHEADVYEVHYVSIPHESQIGNPDLLALVTTLDINTPDEYEMAVKRFAGL